MHQSQVGVGVPSALSFYTLADAASRPVPKTLNPKREILLAFCVHVGHGCPMMGIIRKSWAKFEVSDGSP